MPELYKNNIKSLYLCYILHVTISFQKCVFWVTDGIKRVICVGGILFFVHFLVILS